LHSLVNIQRFNHMKMRTDSPPLTPTKCPSILVTPVEEVESPDGTPFELTLSVDRAELSTSPDSCPTTLEAGDLGTPDYESCRLAVWYDSEGELDAVRDAEGTVYRVQGLAGAGATGSVYKVVDPTGRVLAIKAVHRGRYAEVEMRALERLRHPNVLRLLGAMGDTRFRQTFLLFEFIEGGHLCNMTPEGLLIGEEWTEADARRVLLDLAASVAHLHQNDVVHRDIKPQNCLRRRTGEVVLCDFGASELPQDGDDSTRRAAGTPFFYPPEACSGKCFGSKGQDVWALGITLYLLVFGRVPFGFGAQGILELSARLESEPLEMAVPGVYISPECRDFLEKTLEKDVTRRLGLRDIMHHPWVTGEHLQFENPMATPDMRKSFQERSASPLVDVEASYRRNSKGGLSCSLVTRARQCTFTTASSETDSCSRLSTLPEGTRVLIAGVDSHERNHLVRRIKAVTDEDAAQSVDTCGDGVLAHLSGSMTYAAVFFPLHLFASDAVGVAKAIREWEAGTGEGRMVLVVVAHSVSEEQRQHVLDAGADEVLLMPARLGKLRRVLRKAGWATVSNTKVDELYDSRMAYDSQCLVHDMENPISPETPTICPLPPRVAAGSSFCRQRMSTRTLSAQLDAFELDSSASNYQPSPPRTPCPILAGATVSRSTTRSSIALTPVSAPRVSPTSGATGYVQRVRSAVQFV